jgi:hypothetical protein
METWYDFHLKRYLIISFIFVLIIFTLNAVRPKLDSLLKPTMILPLVPLLLLIIILRIKLSSINTKGIKIGNAPNGEYYSVMLSKSQFIEWDKIKSIKLYNKAVKQPLMVDYQSFLLIKTKDGQKYESFIAQPEKFLLQIKKLRKAQLVSTDSKYYDLIKK